ncbi:DsbA family protein [Halobacteriovorax sp.]|uniref:DsbA family protein n=1 Tax=Halobacteriovorax sp. TaxID=2020862 RepID=UPI0035662C94
MKKQLLLLTPLLIFASCTTQERFEEKLTKTLIDRPEILTKVIESNPDQFVIAFQNAVRRGQQKIVEQRKLDQEILLKKAFDNPFKPVIRKDELIRGTKGAPITVVEYSDFECPYCSKGFKTVKSLLKKYDGKVQFVFKHLPLSFHENAVIAAKYYEAVRLQDEKLAIEFHDYIFNNQSDLKSGEKFLKELSKKLGVNMKRLSSDLDSEAIKLRIAEDLSEASRFGMEGTPGFLVNGIPIRGAYPLEHFDMIISKLVERGSLKL